MQPLHFRSIWISDTHLGTRHLQAESLLQFLRSTESDYLYLVGDIFDLLQLKSKWHWSPVHDQIIKSVSDKANSGTKVYYLPGNHDQPLRRFEGSTIHGITISNKLVHETADGSSYLVLHGDIFDCVVQNNKWLAEVGGWLYNMMLCLNHWHNVVRRKCGKEYWSISAYLKHKVKEAVNYISRYEEVLVREIKAHNVDGLICGHIHHASIKMLGNVLYTNTGDWVESCTALAENHSGTIGIIEWNDANPHKVLQRSSLGTDKLRTVAPVGIKNIV